jgi:hypothetical protein
MFSFLQHFKSSSVTLISHVHLISYNFILQFFINKFNIKVPSISNCLKAIRDFWLVDDSDRQSSSATKGRIKPKVTSFFNYPTVVSY